MGAGAGTWAGFDEAQAARAMRVAGASARRAVISVHSLSSGISTLRDGFGDSGSAGYRDLGPERSGRRVATRSPPANPYRRLTAIRKRRTDRTACPVSAAQRTDAEPGMMSSAAIRRARTPPRETA
jgi:hypothetical protein